MHRCAACGAPLFDDGARFVDEEQHLSFRSAVSAEAVEVETDRSHPLLVPRVRCAACGAELGHLLDDALEHGDVAPGAGPRYKIRRAALRPPV